VTVGLLGRHELLGRAPSPPSLLTAGKWVSRVMAGYSGLKDDASLAYVAAIHFFLYSQDVDARHKAGHDVESVV